MKILVTKNLSTMGQNFNAGPTASHANTNFEDTIMLNKKKLRIKQLINNKLATSTIPNKP